MEKIKRKQSLAKYLKERLKTNIAMTVLIALYVAFCIGSIIYFAIIGRGRDCIIGVAYVAIAPVVYLAEYGLKIRSPLPYTIFVIAFSVFCYLGASYNFYTIIPMLDDILHACWGVLFTTLGFCVVKSLLGEPKTVRQFVACILFGIGFCMLLSVLWEIYEYACDCLMPNFDMQQDTIVNHIHSFLLFPDPFNRHPDNLHTWQIGGIDHTVIFDADGNELATIPGYLDIGLHDTMWDIIWCVIMTCALSVVLAIDRKLGGKLYPHIIPVYIGKEGKPQEEKADEAVEPVQPAETNESGQSGEIQDKVE